MTGLVAVCTLLGLFLILRGRQRSASDVLIDLQSVSDLSPGQSSICVNRFESKAQSHAFIYMALSSIAALIVWVAYWGELRTLLLIPLLAAFGTLVHGRVKVREENRKVSAFDRALPLLLEQLVLICQSGRDIPSSMNVLLSQKQFPDYCHELLKVFQTIMDRLHQGVSFLESVHIASKNAPTPAVRHVLLYLAGAHRDGAGVKDMMRELSDATQQRVEDTVEEEIAKMPAKATVPLLVAFAGLLLLFLTVPLLRVLTLLQENTL